VKSNDERCRERREAPEHVAEKMEPRATQVQLVALLPVPVPVIVIVVIVIVVIVIVIV
jgi:hypothetical protein